MRNEKIGDFIFRLYHPALMFGKSVIFTNIKMGYGDDIRSKRVKIQALKHNKMRNNLTFTFTVYSHSRENMKGSRG